MTDKNLARLVDELKTEGIDKGRQEARQIVEEAKREADAIVARAKKEADATLSAATTEAESVRKMAQSAAAQAGVSLLTSLTQSVDELLGTAFNALVKQGLEDDAIIQQMLLSFAQQLSPGASTEITVSDAVDLDALTRAVFAAVSSELARGIEIKAAPHFSGIAVQQKGDSVKYELTDALLGEMIRPFLSERARQLLFPSKKE